MPRDQHFSGHLLVNLEKIESTFPGVCRVIFSDNIKNGDFHKVRTNLLIDVTLVNKNGDFTKIGSPRFSWFTGSVKCLRPVFGLHKPPYRKPIKQTPFNNYSSILSTHIVRKGNMELRDSKSKSIGFVEKFANSNLKSS